IGAQMIWPQIVPDDHRARQYVLAGSRLKGTDDEIASKLVIPSYDPEYPRRDLHEIGHVLRGNMVLRADDADAQVKDNVDVVGRPRPSRVRPISPFREAFAYRGRDVRAPSLGEGVSTCTENCHRTQQQAYPDAEDPDASRQVTLRAGCHADKA